MVSTASLLGREHSLLANLVSQAHLNSVIYFKESLLRQRKKANAEYKNLDCKPTELLLKNNLHIYSNAWSQLSLMALIFEIWLCIIV